MKEELAEALLSKVMGWSNEEKAHERAYLQDFALYKYDEYQQFVPGRRFIESLALWLRQFKRTEERRIAYNFIRNRLIFISSSELRRLVELAFPTIVRPILIERAARQLNISPLRPKAVMKSTEYKALLRQCLILGLSDGARTDIFRRANPVFSNEQVWHAYEVSENKASDMLKKLEGDLRRILCRGPTAAETSFNTVVLLDDFSASGTSYLRHDPRDGWKGKIWRVIQMLGKLEAGLVGGAEVHIIVVLYVAAPQAIQYINEKIEEIPYNKGSVKLHVVHQLSADSRLSDIADAQILGLAAQPEYFDPIADDEHGAVAGTSKQFGYADCRLPLVLSHNTPNNSLFLLWGAETHRFRGLFPRVDRHRRVE